MSEKKEPRTIQVKIGQQSAREMTPDQAAEYLKCMATASGSNPLRTDRVAFTFGSRSNGGSGGKSGNDNKSSFWKISAEAKEIAANSINAVARASAAAAATTTSSPSSPRNGAAMGAPSSSTGNNNSSIPCTEKEMKALMSMFVEIMGLQMNTEKLNSVSKRHRRKNLFRFPEDIPPPPGGWPADMTWPVAQDLEDYETEEDDTPEDDSVPDLEDIPVLDRDKKRELADAEAAKHFMGESERLTTYSQSPAGYVAGIAVPEWEALERVAMEDALEQEERARKAAQAASNTGKKGKRGTQRVNIPTSPGSVDTTDKRRSEQEKQRQQEKAITQWRQKVVSSCQSNDTEAVKELLKNSPIHGPSGKGEPDESVSSHIQQNLMDIAAQCLPKNRQSIEKGRESRSLLLDFVLKSPAPRVLLMPQRNGRSVLHTSCFYGDMAFVKLILENASAFENLAKTCEESGFTPLHYASLSGSSKTVQLLVKKEWSRLKDKVTNDTHTWDPLSGKGLSVTQLLRCVLKQSPGKNAGMETHGMAVAEVQKDMMGTKGSAARYCQWLEQIAFHLENNSMDSLSHDKLKQIDKLLIEDVNTKPSDNDDFSVNKSEKSDGGSTAPVAGKKKKKKKKSKQNESKSESSEVKADQLKPAPSARPSLVSNDPLVELLKGMGFEEGPVVKGIMACGGPDRATADLVIAWMLEQNQPEVSGSADASVGQAEITATAVTPRVRQSHPVEISAETKVTIQETNSAVQVDEEKLRAEKLAAKREERRQRNREWNKKQEAQRTIPTSTPTVFPKQQVLLTSPPVPSPVAAPVAAPAPSPAPATGPVPLSGRTVEFSVDASNAMTSAGEYGKDDDLTVSTIGSRTTTTQSQSQPPPMTTSNAVNSGPAYNSNPSAQNTPPGFNSLSNMGPSMMSTNSVKPSESWHSGPLSAYQFPPSTAVASTSVDALHPPGLNPHLYSGLPPGIPETHPLVEERVRAPYRGELLSGGSALGHTPGLEEGPPLLGGTGASGLESLYQPRMSSQQDSFGVPGMLHQNPGGFSHYPMSNPNYSAMDLGSSVYPTSGMAHTVYTGAEVNKAHFSAENSLFAQSRSDARYMGAGGASGGQSSVPPLSASPFGFPAPGIGSSMIESISTGNEDLGGSSLWNPSDVLSGAAPEVTSSLLIHLIYDSENDNKKHESLFGAHHSSDDGSRNNNHSIW